MNDITALAQRNDLLIANGQQTADLLRHLASNYIDSDYFAVTSECEAYGTETEAELSITEFALQAAVYVDALVEALEARDKQIAEHNFENRLLANADRDIKALRQRIAELESRTVKLPRIHSATEYLFPVAVYSADEMKSVLAAADIQIIEGEA